MLAEPEDECANDVEIVKKFQTDFLSRKEIALFGGDGDDVVVA